nr:Wadjet anti-phage system protein JetD domain-containing protein [Arthrobacter crystallopoietes]
MLPPSNGVTNGWVRNVILQNHPHIHSVMMDLETLLAHKEFRGTETKPPRAVLNQLSPDEAEVYAALANDRDCSAAATGADSVGMGSRVIVIGVTCKSLEYWTGSLTHPVTPEGRTS